MHLFADGLRRSFTLPEFRRMGEAGIVPAGGVELVEGAVVERRAGVVPRRWSYDDYLRMGEAGILAAGERTELINGEIVQVTPVGHRHVYVVDLLTELLGRWAFGRAILRVQSPLRFHDFEAPHPDLALLRPHEDRYRSREAGPWDALLVVEVADTSLARDREKAALYARAAIPEYWLVDVAGAVVVYRHPVSGAYADVRVHARGESFVSDALDGERVRVDDVLGPA